MTKREEIAREEGDPFCVCCCRRLSEHTRRQCPETTYFIANVVSPSTPTAMVALPEEVGTDLSAASKQIAAVAAREALIELSLRNSPDLMRKIIRNGSEDDRSDLKLARRAAELALSAAPKPQPSMIGLARDGVAGVAAIPADRAARQLMGLYYELSGNSDMAAEVRSDDWEIGTGSGPGSERELLAVMAAMVTAVREEFAAALSPPPEQHGESPSLLARIAELEEALRPFALTAEKDIGEDEADSDRFRPMERYALAPQPTVGMFRRARAALILTGKEG